MKTNVSITLTIHLLISLFTFGQEKSKTTVSTSNKIDHVLDKSEILLEGEPDYFTFKFPEGTKIVEKENEVLFELPEGYIAYGINDDNRFTALTNGTLTCTCSSGSGGCSPAKSGNIYACAMTSCNTCNRSVSSSASASLFRDLVILNVDEPVGFFKNADELNGEILLPAEFFKLDLIDSVLLVIYNNLDSAETTETRIYPISIYGYVFLLEVAANLDDSSPHLAPSSVSCACNTNGTCTRHRNVIATYCDSSSCKSCTLTATISNPGSLHTLTFEANANIISVY